MTAAQTQRLYFTALYLRDVRDLQRQTATLTEDLNAIVQRRYAATLATPAEQTMAQVAVRQTRAQAALAEANYQTALLTLRRQLNLNGDQPVVLMGSLETFAWFPIDELYQDPTEERETASVPSTPSAELARNRPDVMAAAAAVDAARANAVLARANRIPSPQIGPFYERDDAGTVFAGLRAQSNLPISIRAVRSSHSAKLSCNKR